MSSTSNHDPSSIDHILADYLTRLDRGEKVDKRAFMQQYPAHAKRLQQFFQIVGEINDQARPDETQLHISALGDDVNMRVAEDATVDHTPGRSRGLHIRCPHCSNGVELLADTPFDDITCNSCGSTFNLAVREEQTSAATALQQVGRFELVSRLGVGGFGTVWKARDRELDRVVAVKIPRKGQLSSMELEQFFREARSAAQLRHPNIVPVYEVGKEGDTIFIVCAFVRGVSLADLLTGQRPELKEACLIVQTVAKALHHAHENGVIHRDLKPSNIMLDQANIPYLMDFGLAKRDVNEITMTVDGQILGTPAYMSPEQAMGQAHWTDRRTDIYSLGVMLFEMLTGEKPFRGNAQMQVHQRLNEDAPDPRSLNRHIPRDLTTICVKCMERDPNRRYNNCQLIVEEFDRYFNGMPIVARPVSRTERFVRWCKRKPALATAAALTAILAVAGPTAAYRIDTQRERLADLVLEKDDLITQMSSEKEDSVNQLSKVTGELRLLQGQENPWNLWPADRDVGPTKQLLVQVYQTHAGPLAKSLESNQHAFPQNALGYLALASLAEHIGKLPEAKAYYQTAAQLFEHTPAELLNDPVVLRAQAECLVGISRLADASEKDEADVALSTASKILDKLKSNSKNNIETEVQKLDTDLRRAVFAKPKDAKKHLTQSVLEISQLVKQWPAEPSEFYALVSKISGTSTKAKTSASTPLEAD
jgi:serine/threonine protein kinase/ribosomal protein S27E